MNRFFAMLLFIILAGCAATINRRNAEFYHQAGLRAEWKGDFQLAERNFSRALINARLGDSPKGAISMATYNLGRVKGYLCKHKEAEELLLEALMLEEKAIGPQSGIATKRLFEPPVSD